VPLAYFAVANAAGGVLVNITCQKTASVWPNNFAPGLKATAGSDAADCTDDGSDYARPTVTPLPVVRVVIDPVDPVCSDDQDGFTFTATVFNDNAASNATMDVTAVWGETACTADPDTGGECGVSWWATMGGGVQPL
jgi:hypothetical protein